MGTAAAALALRVAGRCSPVRTCWRVTGHSDGDLGILPFYESATIRPRPPTTPFRTTLNMKDATLYTGYDKVHTVEERPGCSSLPDGKRIYGVYWKKRPHVRRGIRRPLVACAFRRYLAI